MSWARPPQPSREERLQLRQQRMAAQGVSPRAAVVGGSTTGPAPKSEPHRDDALLQMAKGRPCLVMLPAVCNHRTDTTVAAHSNLGQHGKGMARKADDAYSVWACFSCHLWLDTGKARASDKERAFMAAHARQVLAWRLVAQDHTEPERFRRAARRALEHLNATPLSTELDER